MSTLKQVIHFAQIWIAFFALAASKAPQKPLKSTKLVKLPCTLDTDCPSRLPVCKNDICTIECDTYKDCKHKAPCVKNRCLESERASVEARKLLAALEFEAAENIATRKQSMYTKLIDSEDLYMEEDEVEPTKNTSPESKDYDNSKRPESGQREVMGKSKLHKHQKFMRSGQHLLQTSTAKHEVEEIDKDAFYYAEESDFNDDGDYGDNSDKNKDKNDDVYASGDDESGDDVYATDDENYEDDAIGLKDEEDETEIDDDTGTKDGDDDTKNDDDTESENENDATESNDEDDDTKSDDEGTESDDDTDSGNDTESDDETDLADEEDDHYENEEESPSNVDGENSTQSEYYYYYDDDDDYETTQKSSDLLVATTEDPDDVSIEDEEYYDDDRVDEKRDKQSERPPEIFDEYNEVVDQAGDDGEGKSVAAQSSLKTGKKHKSNKHTDSQNETSPEPFASTDSNDEREEDKEEDSESDYDEEYDYDDDYYDDEYYGYDEEEETSTAKVLEVVEKVEVDSAGNIVKEEEEEPSTTSGTTIPSNELANSSISEATSQKNPILTSNADTFIGHYQFPSLCNITVIGHCKYLLMMYKLPNSTDVKFVIMVKNETSTTLGFTLNQSDNFEKSNIIVATGKNVTEKIINEAGTSEDYPESQLKNVQVQTIAGGTLYVTFVKSMVAQDSRDVALGTPGGLFYFMDGKSQNMQNNEYVWLKARVDLSPFVSANYVSPVSPETENQIIANGTLASPKPFEKSNILASIEKIDLEPLTEPSTKITEPHKVFITHKVESGSCQSINGVSIKFPALGNHGFKKYLSCHEGRTTVTACPKGSIFYYTIQCCVPIMDFPCSANCLKVAEEETSTAGSSTTEKAPSEEDFDISKNAETADPQFGSHDYSYFLE